MKETILLFHNLDKQTLLKVEMALFPLKVRIRTVPKEDYLQPLGALAGLKEVPRTDAVYDGEPLSDTMFIFSFFSDSKLNEVLAALRKSGAGPFPYKAVLTTTNRSWTALDCLKELHREKEAIEAQKKAFAARKEKGEKDASPSV